MEPPANMKFGWTYPPQQLSGSHCVLVPYLMQVLRRLAPEPTKFRVIDIGCGNGAVTNLIRERGFKNVEGIEPSEDGVEVAKRAFPELTVSRASAYEDLPRKFGQFDAVVCLEVIEHLYSPDSLARNIHGLLRDGGFALLSTPYHGYVKNVALSVAGKWDFHHHPLVEHGHIKFWSRNTLEALLARAGLRVVEFHRLGRVPILAKSMFVVATKSI
jgi:2-polyprenyl-6-hydroxyphenyl methylase/3-demethylubiquinone-9 3-methyltransferase